MRFVHVSIRTNDIDKSIEFYQKYFNMVLVNRKEIKANNAEIAFLKNKDDGFRLEITHYKNQKEFKQAEYEDRVWDHLAFNVDNMDHIISRLKKDGVTITDEPFNLSPSGPLIAFIEDPVGVLIELIES
ncbi:MAG: VOC family protein [Candidatus Bathyarchaeota archaeon]|nr:VOC family protein [Candidatus Bathyarchaeota archaeon]MCZ2846112.1 VOC family protein [Candidatus Bathyarchaeota archaeon]